jgi:putative sigma-54 modulation protein
MDIQTTARHFELTTDVREHGEGKVKRLARYFDQIQDASITITKEKFRYKTEITLAVSGGGDFVGTEETADAITSLDGAVDALEQQIRKHKGRLIDRREKREKTGEALADAQAAAMEADETGRES